MKVVSRVVRERRYLIPVILLILALGSSLASLGSTSVYAVDPPADSDGDGVPDSQDNCPSIENPRQFDVDGDGIGDACDTEKADADHDTIIDEFDNCLGVSNPSQADHDFDGAGDACDTEGPDGNTNGANGANDCRDGFDNNGDGLADGADLSCDGDQDGVFDLGDNCPSVPNDQADHDFDGKGDACDTEGPDGNANGANGSNDCRDGLDNDGDGFADGADSSCDGDRDGVFDAGDNCLTVANSGQEDADGDQIGDACDPPAVPVLLAPGNGSTISDDTPTFDWNGVGSDSASYQLQVDNNNDFSSPEIDQVGLTTSDFTPVLPLTNGTYSWHVRTFNSAGLSSSYSGAFSVTIAFVVDTDGDGVQDSADLCPGTPAGQAVNASGCAQSQLDDDQDGVSNDRDLCQSTASGELVNANGCSQSQLDDDHDGVKNNVDQCPGTPSGEAVNANGCSQSQLDDDADGVKNSIDQCPGTAAHALVDSHGCSQAQVDSDGDGICNSGKSSTLCAGADNCPATPNSDQADSDHDGIGNACDPDGVGPVNKDQCNGDGWKVFYFPRSFKNQGDCIQYVNTGR